METKNVELIAKICHEVNKIFCEFNGDNSQTDWENAPQWQKDSAINGVNYHLDNTESKPADSHINWMKEKLEQGWKYGEVKNPAIKEHPCIVAFDDLPKNQQYKDIFFTKIVKIFAKK